MSKMGDARKEAMRFGHKHYVPERHCRYGHKALRYTSSGNCVECHAVNVRHYENLRRGKEILRLRADWSVSASYARPGLVKSEDPVP